MPYEVPSFDELEDRTKKLPKNLNRNLNRYKVSGTESEYGSLRDRVTQLRRYYTDRGGVDNLRLEQITFITDIMTMLPRPGKGSDETARLILLGALFHRLERIEFSYDGKQLAQSNASKHSNGGAWGFFSSAAKSWATSAIKCVVEYAATNSELYKAIGEDVLNLNLDKDKGTFIIDPLTKYDSCKALADFLMAEVKTRSTTPSEQAPVYTKLKYIYDEKGQEAETGKVVFDRGLNRIIDLHKENATRMKAVHYFTSFAVSFSEQIKTNCPDVQALLETLDGALEEILGQGQTVTKENFVSLFSNKGLTEKELNTLRRFIPVDEKFNSLEHIAELKEKTRGILKSYQMFLISGMYFFMLDEATKRASAFEEGTLSHDCYSALVTTLKEVLGLQLKREDDVDVLEAKRLCFQLLSEFMTGCQFNSKLNEFPSNLERYKQDAQEFPLLKGFRCFGTLKQIENQIIESYHSVDEVLNRSQVDTQQEIGIVATL